LLRVVTADPDRMGCSVRGRRITRATMTQRARAATCGPEDDEEGVDEVGGVEQHRRRERGCQVPLSDDDQRYHRHDQVIGVDVGASRREAAIPNATT